MVANFVPWEHGDTVEECKPAELTPESLTGWISHLEQVATSSDSSGLELTIARGRLHAIRQWANGLRVDDQLKQVHVQWRLRNRKIWDEDERAKAAEAAGTKTNQADDEIFELHAQQKSANVDPKLLTAASEAENWMERQLQSMGLTLPGEVCASASEPESWGDGPPSARELGVANISAGQIIASNKAMRTEAANAAQAAQPPPPPPPPPGPGGAGHATPPYVVPAAFEEIDDDALAEQNRLWQVACEAAKAAGNPRPSPPLGVEQREICRAILPVLHEMKVAHDTLYSEKQTLPERKEWMARAKETAAARGAPLETQYMLIGPAGAGKTEVIKALHEAMAEEQMGTLGLTAYQGSAVVQLEDAVTLLTMLGFGIEVPYKQDEYEKLKPGTINRFKQYADPATLRLLVIDETSFLNGNVLHHVDMRLRALLECEEPFGGLVVLLAGVRSDACQHTRPRCVASDHEQLQLSRETHCLRRISTRRRRWAARLCTRPWCKST